jgi:O-antigen ligase
MSRLRVDRLRSILLHPYWLTAALSAAVFLQFGLNRGGVESAIWVAGLFLLLHAGAGTLDLRRLPRREWLFLAAIGFLLLVSWAVAPAVTDPHRVVRLVKLAVIALAVRHLASQPIGDAFRVWVAAVAVAIVLWQTGGRLLAGSRYGTFANPHYLAYFALLLLPVLVTVAAGLERRHRYLLYLVVLLDLALVFNMFRTPAIPLLALGTGLGALAWSVAGLRARWAIVALAIGVGLAAMLTIDDTRIGRLGPAASAGDERVEIWSDTVRMLADSDPPGWLLGNGIGSFRNDYLAYFQTPYREMPLPHNHVLELLYENGALLTALIVGFLLHVGWRSLEMARTLADPGLSRLAQCNLVLFGIWLVFSFLAFGVYSRYTLYPFGFILGVHFFLARRADAEDRPGPSRGRPATA